MALERSHRDLSMDASLGVCTLPIVEKIGLEICPRECHLLCYTGLYSGPPFPPSSLYSYTIYSCISNRNDGQNAENCDTDKRRFVSWLIVRAEKRRKAYHVTGQCVQRNGERRIKLRVKGDYMLAEKTEKCS